MTKPYLLIIIALIAATQFSTAQNEIDALRYSMQDLSGSARFSAMGGTFGALGADFSTTSHNPAGIGMYQYSEFSLTPSLQINNNTTYYGEKSNNYKKRFNIGGLGLVFTVPKLNSEWKRINISLGWNQIADYNSNINIVGQNSTASLVDEILSKAQGQQIDNLDPLYAGPAYSADLIDLLDTAIDNGQYISHVSSNSNKTQEKRISTEGSSHEFIFSIGGAYSEKLYLGATIGIPTIELYESSIYTERNFEDTVTSVWNGQLHSFNFSDELTVYATGINLKIGAIMRLTPEIKVGASVHSPTFYELEETYSTTFTTNFPQSRITTNSSINYFEYNLTTPWRAILSLSSTLNKHLLLSADYEIIDYSFSKLYSNEYMFTQENNNINNLYTQTENISIGSEIRFNSISIRGGYKIFGSPYTQQTNNKREKYCFGIGVNYGSYYLDASYLYMKHDDEYLLLDNPVRSLNERHNLLFTLGFRY